MSKTKTIRANFSDKHKEYIKKAVGSTLSVAEGSVRAGKTVDNVFAFAYLIDSGVPDRFHLATGSTAANAKLNIGDCNGMGLEHLFRGRCRWTQYKGNDALVISANKRESVVIFAGAGKADSFKKIRGNSYGMWIATEINLHHENTIKEAFNRQLAARVRKVFWDLNPTSPGDWIYKNFIDRFPETYGAAYNYGHFTIRDNATVSPERLAEIEAQYDQNSVWYRRDILGERCNAEGLVYQFSEDNITDTVPDTGEYYISVDYGTMNPFSAGLWCVVGANAVRIKEYYYGGRESRAMRTDEEYCDSVETLAKGYNIRKVIVDPSAASFIAALRKRHFSVLQADNDVMDGIRRVAVYLRDGNIKIHRSCTDAIKEFGLYRWDEKSSEDKVVKENDHCITGDTLIDTADGAVPVSDLVGKEGFVWSYNRSAGRAELRHFYKVRQTNRNAEIYKITLEDGRVIRATADHPVLTERGYIEIKYLKSTDNIIDIMCVHTAGMYLKPQRHISKHKTPSAPTNAKRHIAERWDMMMSQKSARSAEMSIQQINIKKQSGVRCVGIKRIEYDGVEPVYNMEVEHNHNYSVNGGLIVHNCMDDIRYFCSTVMRKKIKAAGEAEYTPIWG